jgi:pyruvate dehydrogenase E2 component (dihydrolipoamide acetyltransferase)
MPTSVVMPQMGESIAEGTIVRWIKRVGDAVEKDEPLFEISTDKVDAEIPSPAGGVLLAVLVNEGETVPVESVVAMIGAAGEPVDVGAAPTTSPGPTSPEPASPATAPPALSYPRHATDEDWDERIGTGPIGTGTIRTDTVRRRLSPVVRRIADDQDIDVNLVDGTGLGGRVTKRDVLRFIDMRATTAAKGGQAAAASTARVAPYQLGDPVEVKPLSIVRRKIAEHMVLSRRTSAHVHTVFHVDFTAVERARRARRAEFERVGVKLTAMAFIAQACAEALRKHTILNAALDGETVVYKKDINLGIAVAIDAGLIVPVVRHADTLSLLDLSISIADVAARARTKQLKPEEVHGGTFTITNPGQLGAQFGMPIINQPQVAILGVGTIEKRPVVIGDAIVVRPMAYLALGFDHRLVDGFAADQFMADVKRHLESVE